MRAKVKVAETVRGVVAEVQGVLLSVHEDSGAHFAGHDTRPSGSGDYHPVVL